MTHRVTAGIYAQAARLRLKGAPFFGHPARRARKAGVAAGGLPAPGRRNVDRAVTDRDRWE